MYCEQCKNRFSGIYCPQCGQKGALKRFHLAPSSTLTSSLEEKEKSCQNCFASLPNFGEFCSSCGHKNMQEREVMTFSDYKNSLGSFKKRLKPKHPVTDHRVAKQTIITIKEMVVKEDGSFNSRSGFSIPLQVLIDDSASKVHEAAYDKISRYCLSFREEFSNTELVYKSGEIVEYIPGTVVPFTVKRYKEDSGLQYSRIILYIKVKDHSYDESDEDKLSYRYM